MKLTHFIGGEAVAEETPFESINPSDTDEVIARYPAGGAAEIHRDVRVGMVMVNLPTAGVDYHAPFGGMRGSSHGGREQGFAAIDFYTQIKTIYLGD